MLFFCPFQQVLQIYFQYVSIIYIIYNLQKKNTLSFIIWTWKASI